ncbi:MAG: hypothetical protein ACYTGO_05650 [Planctomycetota bacterium]|jgi:hypothetical protein
MTPRIAIVVTGTIALALLAQPASADKFYFGSEADQKKTQGNAANDNFIEGVLLKEDKDSYTIRILGGQMNVAKSMVYKVEKDGLTVAQLEAREEARKDALAQAENNRRQLQAVEAAARREARAAEASMRRTRRKPSVLKIDVDFQGITGLFRTGGRTIKPFDPVIGRSNLSGLPAIVDVYMRNLLDEQLGNGAGTPPDRTLDVEIGFSDHFVPLRFKTYDPLEVTQQDLDVLQKQIYSHVQHQVLRSAHQNPVMEDMNLPYRRR